MQVFLQLNISQFVLTDPPSRHDREPENRYYHDVFDSSHVQSLARMLRMSPPAR